MKLQKHKAYVYKTEKGEKVEHFKHLVVIPEDVLRTLGWKDGEELESAVRHDSLILKRRNGNR